MIASIRLGRDGCDIILIVDAVVLAMLVVVAMVRWGHKRA
jgi:hypothetical protein